MNLPIHPLLPLLLRWADRFHAWRLARWRAKRRHHHVIYRHGQPPEHIAFDKPDEAMVEYRKGPK